MCACLAHSQGATQPAMGRGQSVAEGGQQAPILVCLCFVSISPSANTQAVLQTSQSQAAACTHTHTCCLLLLQPAKMSNRPTNPACTVTLPQLPADPHSFCPVPWPTIWLISLWLPVHRTGWGGRTEAPVRLGASHRTITGDAKPGDSTWSWLSPPSLPPLQMGTNHDTTVPEAPAPRFAHLPTGSSRHSYESQQGIDCSTREPPRLLELAPGSGTSARLSAACQCE